MEQESDTVLVTIPGQNGLGKSPIAPFGNKANEYIEVSTPEPPYCDFGQKYCQELLHASIQTVPDGKKCVIHASSQGSATAVLYASKKPEKIKMLVLEAMLASGNSAIHHTITGKHGIPALAKIWGLYYIAPYIAKFVFPLYKVSGDQPIEAVAKIPNQMPVVIYHATGDPQLSIGDAQAMYYKLRAQGNQDAFFMPIESDSHVLLMQRGLPQQERLLAFMQNVNDLSKISSEIREKYQPDHMQFKKVYDDMMYRETMIKRISKVLKGGFFISLLCLINRWYPFMEYMQHKSYGFCTKS